MKYIFNGEEMDHGIQSLHSQERKQTQRNTASTVGIYLKITVRTVR